MKTEWIRILGTLTNGVYVLTTAFEGKMNGMVASWVNPKSKLVEIVELKDHPWFVGVQFHPEYRSTVASPHPLFVAFVKAASSHGTGVQAGIEGKVKAEN